MVAPARQDSVIEQNDLDGVYQFLTGRRKKYALSPDISVGVEISAEKSRHYAFRRMEDNGRDFFISGIVFKIIGADQFKQFPKLMRVDNDARAPMALAHIQFDGGCHPKCRADYVGKTLGQFLIDCCQTNARFVRIAITNETAKEPGHLLVQLRRRFQRDSR